MAKYQLTTAETVWYYLTNILTLGSLYFFKVAVKKALVEEVDYYVEKQGKLTSDKGTDKWII